MLQMKLRPEYYKESPGEYARGECSRKHFSVALNFTVYCPLPLQHKWYDAMTHFFTLLEGKNVIKLNCGAK